MIDREDLERQALEEICACQYYDLADTAEEMPDEDLMAIINRKVPCEVCGN